MKPFVSIIVATRNRAASLARTLDALVAQEWPRDRYEIIVADNGSTDGTSAVVQHCARRPDACAARCVFVPTGGKSQAVNAALPLARGEIFAFTDDDVRPEREWLSQLAHSFDDRDVDFVAGRILPDWEVQAPAWISSALYGVLAIPDGGTARLPIRRGVNEHVMPIGANMAVRASVMRRLGGLRVDLGKLDGTLRTGEDHEFFLRLLHDGRCGVYEPAAVVHHTVPESRLNRSYFRQWLYQNGRDVATLARAYPPAAPSLCGVPRYLWREAAVAAAGAVSAAVRGAVACRFASTLRLIWIAGYIRQSWTRSVVVRTSHAADRDVYWDERTARAS